jgi:starch phosphorylase
MVDEYVETFYKPAAAQAARYLADDAAGARAVAQWKTRVCAAWDGITLRRLDQPGGTLTFGESTSIEVAVGLNGLEPDDVAVELVLSRGLRDADERRRRHVFAPAGTVADGGERRYVLDLQPQLCGRLDYRIRAFPRHPLLTHPFEMGLMRWL